MDKDIDIVDELRSHDGSEHRDGFICVRCRGADEIDSLRTKIINLVDAAIQLQISRDDEIDKLRTLISNWVDALEHDETPYDGTVYPRAVNALRATVDRPYVEPDMKRKRQPYDLQDDES